MLPAVIKIENKFSALAVKQRHHSIRNFCTLNCGCRQILTMMEKVRPLLWKTKYIFGIPYSLRTTTVTKNTHNCLGSIKQWLGLDVLLHSGNFSSLFIWNFILPNLDSTHIATSFVTSLNVNDWAVSWNLIRHKSAIKLGDPCIINFKMPSQKMWFTFPSQEILMMLNIWDWLIKILWKRLNCFTHLTGILIYQISCQRF